MNVKVCQTKVLNPKNQQFVGQKINPVNSNFHHPPTTQNEGDKMMSAMYVSQSSNWLQSKKKAVVTTTEREIPKQVQKEES